MVPKMSAQRHLANVHENPSRTSSLQELRRERLAFEKAETAGFCGTED